MRCVRVHELTGPKALRVDEVDPPTCGSHDVLIDVRAAGVNFPEVLLSYGKYQFKPAPPFIPGGEVAGVVKEVGSAVTSVKVGDRVAATMLNGGFAEVVCVPELAVVALPDQVSFEVGAATLLTYLTTWHALVDRANLKEGESLLVLGAAGGVGVAALQLGKMLGARVVAAASTDEKVAFAKSQGAEAGIAYGREDLKERAKALGGSGFDVIYDPVGGPFSEQALRAIGWQGRFLVVGFAHGDIPKIPLNLTLLKGCQIVGVFWGQFAMREPEKNRANGVKIFEAIANGKLAPKIDRTFRFDEATAALERMERREVMGKLVLLP